MVVTVNTGAQTFQVVFNIKNLFGNGDPPAQTFTGTYNTGGSFTTVSPVFGVMTFSISSSGAISGSMTSPPWNTSISRVDLTGTATSQTMTINYTITFTAAAGGGSAVGTLTLNHISS
jgi:hypothetical protein